jgi:predicted nucleotidyltransferase component of viral defense system
MPEEDLRFEEYNNPRGKMSVQGTISYKGPMQRVGSNATVKLDLSNDEILVNEPQLKKIHHPYSDIKQMEIQAYSIEEIFSEKLRTLVERLRPRDLYDVIHLYADKRWKLDKKIVKETLKKKCEYKNVNIPTIELLETGGKKKALISDWESMLKHQIANLESYQHYWDQLPRVFEWLNS